MSARVHAVALGLLLAVACGERPLRFDEPPPVIVITLDTLRADRLGAYGHQGRDCTPRLDAFAHEAVVFEQAFSASSFTPPSHASLFTGLYPSEHGLLYWDQRLGDAPTAADHFAAAGYRTYAVSPLKTLYLIGLDRGFERTDELPVRMDSERFFVGDAAAVNAAALPVLTADDERPVFAWLHYYDAHRVYGRQGVEYARAFNDHDDLSVGDTEAWYQLPPAPRPGRAMSQRDVDPEQARFIEDRYDGGLLYLDEQLGALFDALRGAGVYDEAVIVIAADHGEVLTEHDEEWFSHDPHLVEENLRIPLMVRLPGGVGGGRRVSALASGVDLLPTLLGLLDMPPAEGHLSGRDLSDWLTGPSGPRREVVFAERQGKDRTGQEGVSEQAVRAERDLRRIVRSATHKLVHHVDRGDAAFELYAVDDEHTDLFGPGLPEARALVERYRSQLAQLRPADGAGEARALDPATLEMLGELGYFGTDDKGR